MARIRTLPHRTAGHDRIVLRSWEITAAGSTTLDPDHLEGWDYATDITVERTVNIPTIDGLLGDCGLPGGTKIAALICWHATGTKTRGSSNPVVLGDGEFTLSCLLPGGEISGTVELLVRLALFEDLSGVDQVTASRKGALIWEEPKHLRIALEGNLPRFPMSIIDFRNHPYFANDALWALNCSTDDLERPLLGALCLYLNEANPAHQLVTNEESHPELIDALRADIARQMLDGALDNPDFDAADEHEDDSLGAALAQLQLMVFQDAATAEVREIRRTRRSSYESAVQSATGIGEVR